jgi:hypothetical protein
MLKIYGIVLLVGTVALIVYCSRGHSFDLTTPEKALESFKWTMDQRRWSRAEECLSEECRQYYAQWIEDRSIFDLYHPEGYVIAGDQRFNPEWKIGRVTRQGDTARARIIADVFLMGGRDIYITLDLKKCSDGRWRVDGPRVDFMRYYRQYIPEDSRGWARRVEKR